MLSGYYGHRGFCKSKSFRNTTYNRVESYMLNLTDSCVDVVTSSSVRLPLEIRHFRMETRETFTPEVLRRSHLRRYIQA